ncbi:hypothetical protein TREES_T100008521 [Tupaia chinensis]|uniref:Uncharacterized protein n=1 Tax=Tupaia chinensis TaxID=246437 RepID=L9L9Y7_TUPCH|nr:hypothetical protein TREES_T100008521 [Tupaia chinensis]
MSSPVLLRRNSSRQGLENLLRTAEGDMAPRDTVSDSERLSRGPCSVAVSDTEEDRKIHVCDAQSEQREEQKAQGKRTTATLGSNREDELRGRRGPAL